jgi:hypothetical protein
MGLKKQVIQYKNGEQINVFNSAQEAADFVGTTKYNVSKCCLGKLKSIKGFDFKYTGELTNKHEDNGDVHCPYCDRHFETYNGLCKHVFSNEKPHGNISREKLLTDYKYDGKRPTCKCGCGEYTDISYVKEAHFCDYRLGHSSKIHNNWGHNEQAKLHSAETRRRQYKNGERIQWNKGKTWEETYTEDKIKELIKKYSDESRNSKIAAKLKGVPKSKEHAEKCRQNGRSENSILRNREKIHRMLTETEFSLSSKKEKEFIEYCIKPLGIDYDTQYYLKDIHHYCDVYIPSKNMIIEFQGDYWHGNPNKYSNDELSEYQKKKVTKDNELREYCSENGINLIEIWESDYDRNYSGVKMLLEEQIKQKIGF